MSNGKGVTTSVGALGTAEIGNGKDRGGVLVQIVR